MRAAEQIAKLEVLGMLQALRLRRVSAFLSVTALIYAVAVIAVYHIPAALHPNVLATAVALDLVVIVPIIYFFLFLRGEKRAMGITPIFLISLVGAWLVLPANYRMIVPQIRKLALPAEIGIFAYLILRVRHMFRTVAEGESDVDMLLALQKSLSSVLVSQRLAKVIGYEVAVLYYGLFSWRRRPCQNQRAFSYDQKVGYGGIILALVLVTAMEIIGLHLLVHRWSNGFALLLSALGLYGAIWLLADYRAARLRPVIAAEDAIHVRLGLRWTLRIPYAYIDSVQSPCKAPPRRSGAYLKAALLGPPQMLLELREPVEADGPYGLRKRVQRVGLTVDEPGRLVATLASMRTLASAPHCTP
jgi:hypothetical protein